MIRVLFLLCFFTSQAQQEQKHLFSFSSVYVRNSGEYKRSEANTDIYLSANVEKKTISHFLLNTEGKDMELFISRVEKDDKAIKYYCFDKHCTYLLTIYKKGSNKTTPVVSVSSTQEGNDFAVAFMYDDMTKNSFSSR